MFDSWFDQQRDLEALRSLLADGRADAIADSGSARPTSAPPRSSTRSSGSAPRTRSSRSRGRRTPSPSRRASCSFGSLVGRLTQAPPIVSLASQLVFVALVFAAGTWYWSDVPWSHFFAALLGSPSSPSRFAPARPSVVSAGWRGALLALLAATRSFELLALVLAWGIAAVVFAALRLSARIVERPSASSSALRAFVATTAAVYLATGKRDLFFLYGNHLDHQSGDVLGAEIAETPTLSLALVPAKLVQLFVDPCYLSLCPISDYKTGGGEGSNLDLWSLPLAVQLPALVFLPLCVVGVGARWCARCAVGRLGGAPRESAPARRDDHRVDAVSSSAMPRARCRGRRTCATGSPATSCSPLFSPRSSSFRLPRSHSGTC